MSHMIRYDESPVDELKSLKEHISWSEEDDPDVIKKEFEGKAVSFEITATDGSVIVTGRYHGEARHRDWPLESVRIHTKNLNVEPVRLVYKDGTAYRFDPDFGFAVPDTG